MEFALAIFSHEIQFFLYQPCYYLQENNVIKKGKHVLRRDIVNVDRSGFAVLTNLAVFSHCRVVKNTITACDGKKSRQLLYTCSTRATNASINSHPHVCRQCLGESWALMKGGGFTTGPKAHISPCVSRVTTQPQAGRAPLTSLLIYFGRAKAKARPLAAPRTVPSPGPSLPPRGEQRTPWPGLVGAAAQTRRSEGREGNEQPPPRPPSLTRHGGAPRKCAHVRPRPGPAPPSGAGSRGRRRLGAWATPPRSLLPPPLPPPLPSAPLVAMAAPGS